MNTPNIITHAGMFHADEILSIALISYLAQIPANALTIDRKYDVSEDEFANPNIVVLDVGKRFEPQLLNFDHHQDGNLESTNVLVLNEFGEDERLGPAVAQRLYETFFKRVSLIDRGLVVIEEPTLLEFNTIIRAFNSIEDGFNAALNTASIILIAQIESIQRFIADKERWDKLEKGGGIAISHEPNPILCWKSEAANEDIWLLIAPNPRQKGSYSLISRDSSQLTIPYDKTTQTFRHNNGFLASYASLMDAMIHADVIMANFRKKQMEQFVEKAITSLE